MASGIKGICYNETSQLDQGRYKHSHIRKFWDETRHFTRLSSKIFDNVIYESIYGCSLPSEDIMVSTKRYSILSQSEKEVQQDIKRRPAHNSDVSSPPVVHRPDAAPTTVSSCEVAPRSLQSPEVVREKRSAVQTTKLNERGNNVTKEEKGEKMQLVKDDIIRKNTTASPPEVKSHVSRPTIAIPRTLSQDKSADLANPVPVDVDEPIPEPVDVDVDEPIPEPVDVDEPDKPVKTTRHSRSYSDCSIREAVGDVGRGCKYVDITDTPLYKEIYANNLRQYGFLLAKKLGISNQSPKQLRATYLQNRQKAEQRRDRSNSSLADFTKRLNSQSPPSIGRRVSMIEIPVKNQNAKNAAENTTNAESPPRIIQRSNTIDYVARSGDKVLGSVHSRSISDLTNNKYTDSLTDISHIFREPAQKPPPPIRRMRRLSGADYQRRRLSSHSLDSAPSADVHAVDHSIDSLPETIDTNANNNTNSNDDKSSDSSDEPCRQRVNSGSFSDREQTRKTPTTVMRRKHNSMRDPHKRLSVPLMAERSTSPPRLARKLSLPVNSTEQAISAMSSLSVPDLYHQCSPGKEVLMDVYCTQDVPRRKLSMESLRRHNEAKERLEWRMSKLKSFECVLSEADSFMKDIKTLKASVETIIE